MSRPPRTSSRISAPPDAPAWLTLGRAAAILALCVGVFYADSLRGGLVGFDDNGIIKPLFNPAASSARPLDFVDTFVFGRKLRLLSHRLDARVFGRDLRGHHLSNVAYHLLASETALLAASRFLPPPAALAAALFFALHPLQTESAAYLAGRRDLLMGLFYLAAFALWMRWREGRGGRLALAGCATAAAASMLSKPTAVSFPLVIAAYEVWRGDPGGFWTPRRRAWAGAAAAACAAVVVWAALVETFRPLGKFQLPGTPYWYGGSAIIHWASLPRVLLRAALLTLWPARLIADYSYRTLPVAAGALDAVALCSTAALAALTAAAWRVGRREPLVRLAVAWTILTYLPHLPLIPATHNPQFFAEHWLYLPLFGPALAFGALIARLERRSKTAAVAAVVLTAAALGARTAARNLDWRDDLTLWSATVRDAPDCARARNNLGWAYKQRGRLDQAAEQFRAALAIDPVWIIPLYNYGHVLASLGRFKEAKAVFRRAWMLDPTSGDAPASLVGVMLDEGGHPRNDYDEFCTLHDRNPLRLNNCAVVEIQSGLYANADKSLRLALDSDLAATGQPYPRALATLGKLRLEQGRASEAVEALRSSMAADPDQPVRADLALALGKTGQTEAALGELETARGQGLPPAAERFYLSIILRDARRFNESENALRQAQALGFSEIEIDSQLGRTYAAQRRWVEAEAAFRRAFGRGGLTRDLVLHIQCLWDSGQRAAARSELELGVRSKRFNTGNDRFEALRREFKGRSSPPTPRP